MWLFLKSLIKNHFDFTGSPVAKKILDSWEETLPKFVKVFPKEYRRALGEMEAKRRGVNVQAIRTVETWT